MKSDEETEINGMGPYIPLHFPRTDKKLMVRLNNHKLFDKFSNTNVRNAKAAYELIE